MRPKFNLGGQNRRLGLRRAFTLLEMTVVIMMGVSISSITLMLLNRTIQFHETMIEQEFINSDAPLISLVMSKLLHEADRYELYTSQTDAALRMNQVLKEASTLLLVYQNADQSRSYAMVTMRGNEQLDYYQFSEVGVEPTYGWTITNRVKDTVFWMDKGVLRMTLTGPLDEQITYSGSMK